MLETDKNLLSGQLYKWKEHREIPPILSKYISETNLGVYHILSEILIIPKLLTIPVLNELLLCDITIETESL